MREFDFFHYPQSNHLQPVERDKIIVSERQKCGKDSTLPLRPRRKSFTIHERIYSLSNAYTKKTIYVQITTHSNRCSGGYVHDR